MKTIIIKLLLSAIFFCFFFTGFSQDVGNRIIITSVPLTLNLSTTTQLETEQQINNAFLIQAFSSYPQGYRIYVRISNMTNTSGTPMPAGMNKIQLYNSDLSAQAIPVSAKITLSQTNQLLHSDANRSSNAGDILYYHSFFGPVGYDYGPGTYTFTVLFTMTQP